MRVHLDTDVPEGKGRRLSAGAENATLADAVEHGALRRGWKVVYLQRKDAAKAQASLRSWQAKVPGLELRNDAGGFGSPLVMATQPPSFGLEELVRRCQAATVRIGVVVADQSALNGRCLSGPATQRPGGDWVLGAGSGFLVDDNRGEGDDAHAPLVFTCEHVRDGCAQVIKICGGGCIAVHVPRDERAANAPQLTEEHDGWHLAHTLAHTRNWDSTVEPCKDPSPDAKLLPENYADAAVLQLEEPLPTLPTRGLRLGQSDKLPSGVAELRTFGYPVAVGGTATPTVGTFVGSWEEKGTGRWLKVQGLVMPGHSGGPCVDAGGRVVGWNVRNRLRGDQSGLNHVRPIEDGRECLEVARQLLRSGEADAVQFVSDVIDLTAADDAVEDDLVARMGNATL